RTFGGLDKRSEASYGIQQFFLNGGSVAWVVRVAAGNFAAATLDLDSGSPPSGSIRVSASSPGVWGTNLQVWVDRATRDPNKEFNLFVREVATVRGRVQVVQQETLRNLSMD